MKGYLFFLNRILRGIILMSLFLNSPASDCQILQDTSTISLIRQGIRFIYSIRFREAEDILTRLNDKYPGHPATYLYKGILIYYRNYPLLPSSPERKSLEYQLNTSIRLCEAEDNWPDDPEKLLIDLCSRGLLLQFYNENGLSSEVIPIILTTYRGVRKSFDFTSVYPDFSYFTGLYNYYREEYPKHHQIYKAVALLFPAGDSRKGLSELGYCARDAIVLKAEACSILSWINIYFEKNYSLAMDYSRALFDLYPSNLLFRGEYLKILFLLRKYDEAEKIITYSGNEKNLYFQGQVAVFEGILQEKKYLNYELAEGFYRRGIDIMDQFGARGKEFKLYGSGGLARLKDLKKGKEISKKKKVKGPREVDTDLLEFK